MGTWRVLHRDRVINQWVAREMKCFCTYREILLTSGSNFHLCLRLSRYSIAARSRVVMIPSFSEALAFHMRMLPSSEPESTNRASAVNNDEVTLMRMVRQDYGGMLTPRQRLPLHTLCMVHFGMRSDAFFPYPKGAVPPTTDEFQAGRTPVTRSDCRHMTLINLCRSIQRADVESIQVMVFRGKKN